MKKINRRQWQLYQNIVQVAKRLDRIPDAAEVGRMQPQAAPLSLQGMVF